MTNCEYRRLHGTCSSCECYLQTCDYEEPEMKQYHFQMRKAGDPEWHDEYIEADTQAEAQTQAVKTAHRLYWKNFDLRVVLDEEDEEDDIEKMVNDDELKEVT